MDIKSIRKIKHLTQEQAADLLEVSLRTYKRIESGESNIEQNILDYYISLLNKASPVKKEYKIKAFRVLIVGKGYVGNAIGNLLDKGNIVTFFDTNKELLDATSDENEYSNKDVIIICTPTDFNELTKTFDTSSVLSSIKLAIKYSPKSLIVIKSTLPIGFMDELTNKYQNLNIIYMPEFLKENSAIRDAKNPDRIVIGVNKHSSYSSFIENYLACLSRFEIYPIITSFKEAEAAKLFSNAYLAMRVAFFNELDSFALENNLNTSKIIESVSMDRRIGNYYNNPSFGYGGYCLPKDSKMLSESFSSLSNSELIRSIVDSNKSRKEFIAKEIIKVATKKSNKKIKDITIGVYKVAMKKNSKNSRSSSTLDVINLLKNYKVNILIYDDNFKNCNCSLEELINKSDLIIANRIDGKLNSCKDKLFTRDIFSRD